MNTYLRYKQLREQAERRHPPETMDNFPSYDEWLADLKAESQADAADTANGQEGGHHDSL